MMNENKLEATKQAESRGAKLVFDNRAWELAKVACGPDAILADIIDRAQKIEATLTEAL